MKRRSLAFRECANQPKAHKQRANSNLDKRLQGAKLREAIAELRGDRQRLLVALIDSRRRAPGAKGPDEPDYEDVLFDAWAYAAEVPNPLEDLAELNAPSHPRQEISTAYYTIHFIGE